MSQGEIRDKLQAAAEFLSKNPAEARYTDSVAVARLANSDSLKVGVSGPDGAQLTTDMPLSVGGGNSAASPGWFMRAAAASCVATLISMRAARECVAFDGLEVTVDSESDDRGILGISNDVPAGPLHMRVRVAVGELRVDDEDDSLWELIVSWAVEHCPVTDAVRRSVPVTVEIATRERD